MKVWYTLPPITTVRWVIRKKAIVLRDIKDGLLSFDDACTLYHISAEELKTWFDLVDMHGVRGLRATRMQEYRPPEERRQLLTA